MRSGAPPSEHQTRVLAERVAKTGERREAKQGALQSCRGGSRPAPVLSKGTTLCSWPEGDQTQRTSTRSGQGHVAQELGQNLF